MTPRARTSHSTVARLIIVDDHDLARDGLRVLLAGARRLCIIAEARSAGEAVALCTELTPDLALMDVRLPDMDGLDATRVIRARSPDTRVILFTMYEADDYAQEAVRAGAADYLLKGATRQELLAAIDRALHL
jgi:two-component system NarL family response regulator